MRAWSLTEYDRALLRLTRGRCPSAAQRLPTRAEAERAVSEAGGVPGNVVESCDGVPVLRVFHGGNWVCNVAVSADASASPPVAPEARKAPLQEHPSEAR